MPVQTRSAARKAQTETPCDDQPPQHNPTVGVERSVVQMKVSSTEEGTHTRWIQSSEQNPPTSQPMLPIDNANRTNRFQTPSPINVDSLAVPLTPKQPRHSRSRRFRTGQQAGSVSPLGDVIMDFKKHTGVDKGKNLSTELQRRHATENTPPPSQPVSRSCSTQNSTPQLESPFGGWPSPGQESQHRLFLEAPSDRCSTVDSEEIIARQSGSSLCANMRLRRRSPVDKNG